MPVTQIFTTYSNVISALIGVAVGCVVMFVVQNRMDRNIKEERLLEKREVLYLTILRATRTLVEYVKAKNELDHMFRESFSNQRLIYRIMEENRRVLGLLLEYDQNTQAFVELELFGSSTVRSVFKDLQACFADIKEIELNREFLIKELSVAENNRAYTEMLESYSRDIFKMDRVIDLNLLVHALNEKIRAEVGATD